MDKFLKVKHIVKIANLVLHLLFLILSAIALFLPYTEEVSLVASSPEWIFWLLLPAFATAFSIMSFAWPLVSIGSGIADIVFYYVVWFPHAMGTFARSFKAYMTGSTYLAPNIGTGLKLLNGLSNIVYFDIAFFIFMIVAIIVESNMDYKKKQKA